MRVIAEADYHCYHRAGLCHPDWWLPEQGEYAKWARVQRELWEKRQELIERLKPIDLLILNGDAFDGRGEASGGTELLPDHSWKNQILLAEACAIQWGAPAIVMSRGTPYHVGKLDDYEDLLAQHLGATIKDHPFVEAGGVTFDIKHKCGSSSIPHGRGTSIAKERLWNVLWSEREEQPKGDVILRAHVHYFSYVGGPGWVAMTQPALQAAGTKYGGRQCSGTVDWGLVSFDVEGGEFDWSAHLVNLQANKVEVVKL